MTANHSDNPLSACKRSPRVALDTGCLYTTRAGTARYMRGLLSGFRLLGDAAPSIVPLAWPVENFGFRQPARALKTAYRELIWCRTRACSEIKASGCDLLGLKIAAKPV